MSRDMICTISILFAAMISTAACAMELTYASFLGGQANDSMNRVEVYDGGYYVQGSSTSHDFPVEFTGHQVTPYPHEIFLPAGFVLRFDMNNQLTASTLFAGNYSEYAKDMLVLPDGIVTAWSTTSTDMGNHYANPPQPGSHSPNIMIVKYSLDLSRVEWVYTIAGNDWDYSRT